MRTIYLDGDFGCHVSAGDGLTPVETDFFDGKSDTYVEGYRLIPEGSAWTREDGVVFRGKMIAPRKPWRELDAAQREYERELLRQYEQAFSEIEAALGVSE